MGIEDRGFASMDPEKQRRIATLGGLAVQAKGTAHRLSGEAAREAGRKGGLAAAAKRKLVATQERHL